jgi:hypothetical protein
VRKLTVLALVLVLCVVFACPGLVRASELTLDYPNGGEILIVGSKVNITWTAILIPCWNK